MEYITITSIIIRLLALCLIWLFIKSAVKAGVFSALEKYYYWKDNAPKQPTKEEQIADFEEEMKNW